MQTQTQMQTQAETLPPVHDCDSTLGTNAQQTMAHREHHETGNGLAISPALSTTTAKNRTDAPASRDHDHDHDHDHQSSSFSFAARAAQLARTPTPLLVRGDNRLLRDVTRGPPGDPSPQQRLRRQASASASASASLLGGGRNKNDDRDRDRDRDLVRRRSRYFEDAFAVPRRRHRDNERHGGAGGRQDDGITTAATAAATTTTQAQAVRSAAPVLVELRTNVMVADELAVITALVAHVAARYRRPAAAGVAVALQHSACLCVGGSFAPAYVLAVHALPAELQPATNRRNTALLQQHLAAALGVPPARGLLRFVPVPETNLAYDGRTVAGHMEAADDGHGHGHSHGDGDNADDDDQPAHKSHHRLLSVKSLSSFRSMASRTPRTPHASDRATAPRSRSSSSSATAAAAAAGGDDDNPPPQLPAIPERVLQESLRVCSGETNPTVHQGDQETRTAVAVAEQLLLSAPSAPSSAPSSPATATATPPSTDNQPSSSGGGGRRRVQRTKSFMATLFGRAGGGGSGGSGSGSGSSNGVDSRSSSV